jgi:hypothetical protein
VPVLANALSNARRVVDPCSRAIIGSPSQLRQPDTAPVRQAMIAPHENRDRMAAIRDGQEPIVLVDIGEDRDVASIAFEIVEHLGGIADLHRQLDAWIGPVEGGEHLRDMEGPDRADREPARSQLPRFRQEGERLGLFGERRVVIPSN